MKLFKTEADERQKNELYRIEHLGFWLMYWLMFGAIFIQAFFVEGGFRVFAAEFIIFMSVSLFVLIGCIWRGVWSLHSRKIPGVKKYLMWSLAAAVFLGIPIGIMAGIRNGAEGKGIWFTCGSIAVTIFILCFISYSIAGVLTKKRERMLEEAVLKELDEEENEEE